MAFSAKEIKKAQRIADEIVKKKETKYAKEHKHDKDMNRYIQLLELIASGILPPHFNWTDNIHIPFKKDKNESKVLDRIEQNEILVSATKKSASDGDEHAQLILDVTGMMADDMTDNIRRMAGEDIPKRNRSDEEEYQILNFKIRMPLNRYYLEQAMWMNMQDEKIVEFFRLMRSRQLPSDSLIEHVQTLIKDLAERDKEDLKVLDELYGKNGKEHEKFQKYCQEKK